MRPALALLLLLAASCVAPEAAAQVRRCVDARGNTIYTDRACDAMDATPKEAPVSHAGAYASGFASRGCARTSAQLLDGVRGALEARDVNRLANYYHWTGTGTGAATSLMTSLEAIAARPLVSAELIYPMRLPDLDQDRFSALPPADPASPMAAAPGSRGEQAGPERAAPRPPTSSRFPGWAAPVDDAPAEAAQAAETFEPASSDDAFAPASLGAADGNETSGSAGAEAGPPSRAMAGSGVDADYTGAGGDSGGAGIDALPRPDSTIAKPTGPPPESLLVQQMSGAADAGSAEVRFSLRRNAGCWWIQL